MNSYNYYNICEATKSLPNLPNKDYICHLIVCFVCGIVCSRTESEYYLRHEGNVYISNEDKLGYGLRARHLIKAGTKVMNFMSKGDNWMREQICEEKKRVYYGRVWTFFEYYYNYGGILNEKNSMMTEILETLKKLNVLKDVENGLWIGYNKDITDERKNEIRESKDTYKCACEYIHGVVKSVECISNVGYVYFLQIQLQCYGSISINMVGKGQLLFYRDINCETMKVLGVVESISRTKFVVKSLKKEISNTNLILSKMILDPTFVGYCIEKQKPGHRPSPDKIHSKTSDANFNFNVDGTPLRTYYDVLKNRKKPKEERSKARDILKKIGLGPFSNEPFQNTHASMIMPFVGVYNDIMQEDDLMEFPKTIRSTMHPKVVKLPQFVATHDIQNGEPLTWMYGWKVKEYKVGFPPRRTNVFKSNCTKAGKRRKVMYHRFYLDNIVNETSTPQVIFQYKLPTEETRTILIPTVAEPNCRYCEHSSINDLKKIVDKSGRCLKHNKYEVEFYGHDMLKQRMYAPRSNIQWQKKYNIHYNTDSIQILYGGVPYFCINKKLKISALKPFFVNEFFDTTVCQIFLCTQFLHNDETTEKNMKLKKSTVDVVFRTKSPKEVAIRNSTNLNLTGFVVYNETEEKSAVITKIKHDRGNYHIITDKYINDWKKVSLYTVRILKHVNIGEFLHMSRELYAFVPHLQTTRSFKNMKLTELLPILRKIVLNHNKRFC